MAVLTPIPASTAAVQSAQSAAGPACSLQRSSSLWQLGIEAQELTTAIGQLAEQLQSDDDDSRSQALAELEAALMAEEGNKQALAAKADATCWVIEHLRGQAAYRQQQAKRLTDLSRSDAGRADALEDSLVLVLTRLQPQATRFSFPNHELTSRRSQAVEIDDEQALKAGQQIPGVQLLSHRSWRITSTHHQEPWISPVTQVPPPTPPPPAPGPAATSGPHAWPAGSCRSAVAQDAALLPITSSAAIRPAGY